MKKIVIAILVSIAFVTSSTIYAEGIKVKNYKLGHNVEISGVIGTADTFVNIDKGWEVESAKFNIYFSKSQIINGDASSITVLVNNIPVKSIKLDADKYYKDHMEVDIPKDYLKAGFNEIKVKTYKTVSDKVCRDDSNTGNWIVINKETYTSVKYKEKLFDTKIMNYPKPYTNKDESGKLNTTVLLSDNPTNSELTSSFNASASLGMFVDDEKANFETKLFSDSEEERSSDNLIYISKYKKMNKEIKGLFNRNDLMNIENSAVIKQAKSPFNPDKSILVLTSNNDDILINASKLLFNKKLVDQIQKDTLVLDENSDILTIDNDKTNKITFESLGYGDVLMEGPFSHDSSFNVQIPKNKVVVDKSKIVLDLKYSKNIDFNRSLVTVYINNVPIGSKKLEQTKANGDKLEVDIPNDIKNASNYNVKVRMNLLLKDVECETRETNNPWGYISKKSYVDLKTENNDMFKLKYYPYPFVNEDKFNDLTIVLPERLDSNIINKSSRIAAYLGNNITSNNGKVMVVKSDNLNSDYKKTNIIALGSPKNNKLIEEVNKSLNLKYNKDLTQFEPNAKIKFVDDYGSKIDSIQVIKSPYNKEKSVMVVTSASGLIDNSIDYLTDTDKLKTLTGDTITFDEFNKLNNVTYNSYNKEQINVNRNSKQVLSRYNLIFGGAILLSIATVAGLFVLKNRKAD